MRTSQDGGRNPKNKTKPGHNGRRTNGIFEAPQHSKNLRRQLLQVAESLRQVGT